MGSGAKPWKTRGGAQASQRPRLTSWSGAVPRDDSTDQAPVLPGLKVGTSGDSVPQSASLSLCAESEPPLPVFKAQLGPATGKMSPGAGLAGRGRPEEVARRTTNVEGLGRTDES